MDKVFVRVRTAFMSFQAETGIITENSFFFFKANFMSQLVVH